MGRHLVGLVAAALLATTVGVSASGEVLAQGVTPAARQELAPTGALRFGMPMGAQSFAVGAALGPELARRLGVPFVPVAYSTATAALEGVRSGQVDAAFVPVDPTRATEVAFAAPYLIVDLAYLVPAGSTIRTAADADRPGVRIAAPAGSVYQLVLERQVRAATLVALGRVDAFAAMESGSVHALAYERPTLVADVMERPGFRVVEGRFGVAEHAVAVPTGRAAARTFVTEVVEAAKATGLVQQWVAQAGLAGVQVPPPEQGVRLPVTGMRAAVPAVPTAPHVVAATALVLLCLGELLGAGRVVARRTRRWTQRG